MTHLVENGGFVAGTLVHTKNGLVPIAQIKVGDLVLSRPEDGGELAYKRVVSTVSHENKQLWLVTYFIDDDETPRYLVCTGNHPFWVKTSGWLRADLIADGVPMQLSDGSVAWGYSANRILETDLPGVGWSHYNDGNFCGPTIDMRDNRVVVAGSPLDPTPDIAGENPLDGRVYNFEVEEFHTYFVGDVGVWVHDTNGVILA